jgi:hypothetical protein
MADRSLSSSQAPGMPSAARRGGFSYFAIALLAGLTPLASAASGGDGSNSSFEAWKFALSILGYLGALVIFVVGLRQYRRGDYWKRSEFLAKDMKDYFTDPKVDTAFTLIDWGLRRVRLFAPSQDPLDPKQSDSGERRVDRTLQCSALRPHTMPRPTSAASSGHLKNIIQPPVASSDQVEEATDDTAQGEKDTETLGGVRFTREEAAIRDCYDRLLDGLDRFGNYIAGDLVTRQDLEPYLSYWIGDIASTNCNEEDAAWTVYLFGYIEFYSFFGVQQLFRSFGHDISLDRELTRRLIEKCSDKKQQLQDLLAHIKAERLKHSDAPSVLSLN